MAARRFWSMVMASTGQARTQGRRVSEIALYGQACAQRPHSRHFSGSMYAPRPVTLTAPKGQASTHLRATQRWQLLVTV